ncbi:MAG: UDP-galactopyranose mutase [Lachnospiraceae bacterium]|nr:UDP-galactopyranose mutase [Lachnospiraceae bacterium]
MYDFLIVGSGLFGAVCAHEATKRGKKCLVLERREHIGGNIYTYESEGINVQKYGAHIFNTSDKEVWQYVQGFAEFNRFTNNVIARYQDELYNLPFNMNTFHQLWGVVTPAEARAKIEEQTAKYQTGHPQNLEENALSMVGEEIYQKLIKGYTEKQWGRPAKELPAWVIARIPLRFIYDNNYYDTLYQGVPIGGYTQLIEKMLAGSEVLLKVDFLKDKEKWAENAKKIIYTGMIDEYYDYRYDCLEYRGLYFETETLPTADYQGVAVVNYTEYEVPYTRIIEHKHFEFGKGEKTIITREYPQEWRQGDEAYYPINDEVNTALYNRYKALAEQETKTVFGGRLGSYKYTNMQDTIKDAWKCINQYLD